MGVQRDFKYKGVPVQQAINAFSVFQEFLSSNSFDNVIEIGTSYGGLSLFLYEQSLTHKFEFVTYDYLDYGGGKWAHRIHSLQSAQPDVWEAAKDRFKNQNIFLQKSIDEVSEILKNKKCLLLCDGGDKIEEFNIFSKYIKDGSYIMAHDYSPDKNFFSKFINGKVWNWHEIQDSDIDTNVNKYNLIKCPQYYNMFRDVVWACYTKKTI